MLSVTFFVFMLQVLTAGQLCEYFVHRRLFKLYLNESPSFYDTLAHHSFHSLAISVEPHPVARLIFGDTLHVGNSRNRFQFLFVRSMLKSEHERVRLNVVVEVIDCSAEDKGAMLYHHDVVTDCLHL